VFGEIVVALPVEDEALAAGGRPATVTALIAVTTTPPSVLITAIQAGSIVSLLPSTPVLGTSTPWLCPFPHARRPRLSLNTS
jgi:hypothetical protein